MPTSKEKEDVSAPATGKLPLLPKGFVGAGQRQASTNSALSLLDECIGADSGEEKLAQNHMVNTLGNLSSKLSAGSSPCGCGGMPGGSGCWEEGSSLLMHGASNQGLKQVRNFLTIQDHMDNK